MVTYKCSCGSTCYVNDDRSADHEDGCAVGEELRQAEMDREAAECVAEDCYDSL